MKESEMMGWAFAYAELGWYVFPCREKQGLLYQYKDKLQLPKVKSPYIKNGLLNASTDPQQIRAWWNRWPNACIGCNCGKSGLFVFDCDMKAGRNGWAIFRDMGIDHSGAFHALTPSGGFHIIYSGKGKSGSNISIGLDTRGEGGYIILPPSVIECVGDYVALDDWCRAARPAEVPAEVMARLFPAPQPVMHPRDPIATNGDDIVSSVRSALTALDASRADNYLDWVSVGMALYELGGVGLSLWHEFSARSTKYRPDELEHKWETFHASGLKVGSIFFWAKQDSPNWSSHATK